MLVVSDALSDTLDKAFYEPDDASSVLAGLECGAFERQRLNLYRTRHNRCAIASKDGEEAITEIVGS